MGIENEELDFDNLTPEQEAELRGEEFIPAEEELQKEEDNPKEDDISLEELEEIAGEPKSRMVPHSRFNEVNEKLRLLEAELAEERASKTKEPTQKEVIPPEEEKPVVTVKDLEKACYQAMLDGEEDKAVEIRMEINAIIQANAEQSVRNSIKQEESVKSAQQQQKEFQAAVNEIQAAYPMLDINSEEANEDAIDVVVALRDKYVAQGKSPAEALRTASEKAVQMFGGEVVEKPPVKAKFSAQEAKLTNANAAERIPPKMKGGMGDRATNLQSSDIHKMTDAQFNNMDPLQEKRLRGEIG